MKTSQMPTLCQFIDGDKLMIKDPRITNVHWIFPKKAN